MRVPAWPATLVVGASLSMGCAKIAGLDGDFAERPASTAALPSGGAAGQGQGGAVASGGAAMSAGAGGGSVAGAAGAAAPDGKKPPAAVLDVAAGAQHTCAALADGSVWCWGRNQAGQVAPGDGRAKVPAPTRVELVEGATSVAASERVTCSLSAGDGLVRCWGEGADLWSGVQAGTQAAPVEAPVGEPAASIDGGGRAVCAVTKADGRVRCWGDNAWGQLGVADPAQRGPVEIVDAEGAPLRDVISLGVGEQHVCAVRATTPGAAEGTLVCWGRNDAGQLGAAQSDVVEPARARLDGLAVSRVAAGALHTCASSGERVVCFGDDRAGQCASFDRSVSAGTLTPRSKPLELKSPTLALALGQAHSCVVGTSHGVRCWGLEALDLLGEDASASPCDPASLGASFVSTPQPALAGCPVATRDRAAMTVVGNVLGITAGWAHTCAFDADHVVCWGLASSGQLGAGTKQDSSPPTDVTWSTAEGPRP